MRFKKICCFVLAGVVSVMCCMSVNAATSASDVTPIETLTGEYLSVPLSKCTEHEITPQNTGTLNLTISANSILPLDANVSLVSGEVISYDCTYTPKSASVKFGFIAPDGLFYGLSGSDGSINKGIRVNQPGSYILAIKNNSGSAVTVSGTVNY